MRNTMSRILNYCDRNPWPGQLMYWGGYIVLVACTFQLETSLFFGATVAGVVMHWGGLVTGGRMAREWLEDQP